jgi:GH25 family lysozyme M1 (1,4-beta-N-acetylmuramidase)
MERMPGIDVSRWQRQIDWTPVAEAGYRFVFIRATIGEDYVDPRFHINWEGARSVGLLVSSYHVLKPNVPPDDQIHFFFQTLGDRRGDLPPVLDVERDDGMDPDTITSCVRMALEGMEDHDSRRPIVYTARWCWDRLIRPSSEWQTYDLWVASYTSEPWLPRDWDRWTFWQYSDRGNVPGVGSPSTDLNWFAGTPADLQRYAGKTLPDDQEPEAPCEAGSRVRARVLVPELAVRSGPGEEHERVGTLEAETQIEILSIAGPDVWIEFEPGRWVTFARGGERRMEIAHPEKRKADLQR